ncbi:helix-turn-helix transcriptional regulator [Terasakiella sp. A23]|uniref:helix-turn-helix transcriptional regulator n=1 Tax=Terasakiella sp. FCG-A23 TaxID=3080561 RepID=UPI0029552540|nr:helix-turn-helix transcriptional regulator [Terasakiella sp. A23]MDV7338187.1 helix-turn-helix transcriptional regulator [Terasakiella sp. A23]
MPKLSPKVRPDISDWTKDDLKAWREGHGFDQIQAAAAIGIGRQTWLKMEQGRKSVDLVYYLACVGYDARKNT